MYRTGAGRRQHETSYAYNLLNQTTTVTMPRTTNSQGR